MRTHPAITIVTVILVGFGLKLAFYSAPTVAADVGATKRVSIDVSEMHRQIKNLPVENFHDMTFGFSNGG
jgi:hypothetical protein